jgi:hypothetical protein
MFRETMTSTMPVAMTATEADWTERFHRFRGVRNRPSENRSKPLQISSNAADHAQHACVQFGRLEKAVKQTAFRRAGLKRCGCCYFIGHDGHCGLISDNSMPRHCRRGMKQWSMRYS